MRNGKYADKPDLERFEKLSPDLMMSLVESIDEAAFVLDKDGHFLYVNPKAEELWGRSYQDLIGKSVWQTYPQLLGTETANRIIEVSKTGQPAFFETVSPILRRWVNIRTCSIEPNGIAVFFRDIHDHKTAEAHASRLYDLTAGLAASLTVEEIADVILDKGLSGLGAHAQWVATLSDDGKHVQIVGSHGLEPKAIDEYSRMPIDLNAPMTESIRTGQSIWIKSLQEFQLRYPNLETLINVAAEGCTLVCVPLIAGKKTLGGIGLSMLRDDTLERDQFNFINSLAQLCAQAVDRACLYESEAEARKAMETLHHREQQFLAMLTHELRTPLTAIQGFTSTLLSSDVAWDANTEREFLGIISQETNNLADLIGYMLDMSLLQSGGFRVLTQPTSIDALLSEAVPKLYLMTEHHRLGFNVARDLPLVEVDNRRLVQVLTNLVSNAVKYSPENTEIVVSAYQEDDKVRIDVTDQGLGIPQERRATIFDMYERLHDTAHAKQAGSGLGLPIAKGIVDAHGGQLWIDDREDPGTTMSFTIPVSK